MSGDWAEEAAALRDGRAEASAGAHVPTSTTASADTALRQWLDDSTAYRDGHRPRAVAL